MRLDKYLAHACGATRKEVKQWIRKKRVTINGEVCCKDDTHINETADKICLDENIIQYQSVVYIMMNKPDGVISATQDAVHETVLDLIDDALPPNSFPVGRLDLDTEGLLLICNDGKLAHDLLSPKKHVDKTYYVEAAHSLDEEAKALLESGTIVLDDVRLQPARVETIHDTAFYLTIQEGKYHQVKRMLEAAGNRVIYLKRVRMGTLTLDETLKPGEWRYLEESEIEALKR